ncbi:hypothetical protein GFS31_05140 [Leptolyngbya sp. BL0902]|nr:hypothetical protein GFS31_05140 [Leptolyngbya sp. BL0902]
MLGLALSVGATASVVSIPGLALAAEGSSIVVLPAASSSVQEPVIMAPLGAVPPAPADYYTVSEGDTLWHIAARHQADVDTIKTVNGISQTDVLREGQVLRLPTESMTAMAAAPGAVGGEDLNMAEAPSSLALLSVDGLSQGWVTLESSADPDPLELEAEAEDLEDNALALAEDSLPAAPANDSVSLATAAPSSSWSEADQNSRQEERLAAQPSEALSTAPQPQAETATAASNGWQDAAVDLAAVPAGLDSARPAAPATSPTSEAAPLPMSRALHETSPTTVSRPSPRPASQPVAAAPPAQPSPDASAEVDRSSEVIAAVDSLDTETHSTSAAPARTREQTIQDHLARIRESNGTLVDREMLNERIRQARLELERTRTMPSAAQSDPEVSATAEPRTPVAQSSALLARESTFEQEATPEVARTPASGPVLPNLSSRLATAPVVEADAATAEPQGWTVTDVAADVEAPSPQVALAPQVQLPNLPATAPESRLDRGNLLAAAPMGAEAYRPFPTVEAGQTVSPSMPLLPGSDSFLPEAPNRFNGYIWPTHGVFTSGYGWRWGRMHRGIDVAGPVGTPIVAAAGGVVVRSGWNSGGYGNLVDIRHPDGSLTRYAHNSRLLVREGQQVAQGQQIAEMGSTGRSTGPHLHFEIHLPGTGTVNPMAHLPRR